ncbi:hypothetical protein CYV19_13820 [Natronobacterium gregoryi SP2]|uniref:Uncharacterized protein n=1 Tax=Natronobacterium gregoryi (strain ATCC 43098 / DSM 3393 / CCM 3738 / CIP 104747 / IAM 13177 / JCM 8860 / NBRC 102187 / NCIMB 2189 / SP2) TaxID=797304 RepID=L9Y2F3_NATGS|nr:hypothetical protein C490_10670 [Natronobacterium gregoryi SP2]PLK19602.1 hypothetical protein CYV19_13820 [Natronobacterium gregoryi SP2]
MFPASIASLLEGVDLKTPQAVAGRGQCVTSSSLESVGLESGVLIGQPAYRADEGSRKFSRIVRVWPTVVCPP